MPAPINYDAWSLESSIQDTKTIPYRWICSIIVHYPEKVVINPDEDSGQTWYGTGTLITDRHVLTAAHVISGMKRLRGHWFSVRPELIEVIPGRNDDALNPRPFRTWTASRPMVNSTFLRYHHNSTLRAPYDYALIELKKAIGRKKFLKPGQGGRFRPLGWWSNSYGSYIRPVSGSFRNDLRRRKVNVAGYPLSRDRRGTPAGILVHDFDSVIDVLKKQFTFAANTSKGQSGGPVWIYDKNTARRYLVGIISGDERFGLHDVGVLITPSMIDQFVRWGVPRNWMSIATN